MTSIARSQATNLRGGARRDIHEVQPLKQQGTRPRGFTLIEVMIAVAILGILAAIAIPNYVRYVLRAKQVEAYIMIGAIKNQQFSYLATYDCFVDTDPHPAGVPSPEMRTWMPLGNSGNAGTCGNTLTFQDIDVRPRGNGVYFTYDCDTNPAAPWIEFTCNAVGDLDGDGAQVEFVFCTDNNSDGVTLPSPGLATPCNFLWEPVRLSPTLY